MSPLDNLGLYGNFTLCDRDIIAGLNANFQLLDNLVQLAVTGIVAELPMSPEIGDKYILSTDKTINLWNGTEWVTYPAQEGYIGFNKDDGFIYFFDGTDWLPLPAELIFFDNTGTSITSDNLQGAILELIALVEGLPVSGLANVGTGAEVFKDIVSSTANFRTLTSEGLLEVTEETDEIKIGVNVKEIKEGDLLTLKTSILSISALGIANLPSTDTWEIAADGNGNLVAIVTNVSSSLVAISSDNGATWSAGGTIPSQGWRSIAYTEGVFVIVSIDGTNRIYRSLDNGVTWSISTSFAINYVRVTANGGVFIAQVQSSSTYYRSTNLGVSWSSIAITPTDTGNFHPLFEDKFIRNDTDGRCDIYDLNFNLIRQRNIGFTNADFATGNGVIMAVNSTNVKVSYDEGLSWEDITFRTPSLSSRQEVAYGNGVWLICCFSGAGFRTAYSTDNGNTWTNLDSTVTYSWLTVTYSQGRFLITDQTSNFLGYFDFFVKKELGKVERKTIDNILPFAVLEREDVQGGATGILNAGDAGPASAGANNQRILNKINGYKNDFVTLNTTTGEFTFTRSGKYEFVFTQSFNRTAETASYIAPASLAFRISGNTQINLSTTAAAVFSRTTVVSPNIVRNVTASESFFLYNFIGSKSGGNACYGEVFTATGTPSSFASVKITRLGDI